MLYICVCTFVCVCVSLCEANYILCASVLFSYHARFLRFFSELKGPFVGLFVCVCLFVCLLVCLLVSLHRRELVTWFWRDAPLQV